MSYALNSLVLRHPLELLEGGTLERLRDIGYQAVELIPIDYGPGEVARLRACARAAGVTVLIGWSLEAAHHLADPATAPAGIAQMHQMIDLAERLEAPVVAGLNYAGCGALTGKPPTEGELSRAAEAVAQICDRAARAGVTVCLEPATRDDSYLINTAEQGVAFCDRVGRPNAALLLDTFQMLREERSLGAAIRQARGRIGHFHVSESHRGTPGTGTVPWPEVASALREIGYSGWVGIEAFIGPEAVVAPRAKVWRTMEKDAFTLAQRAMDHLRAMFG